jgi:hypothetical protein
MALSRNVNGIVQEFISDLYLGRQATTVLALIIHALRV